MAVSRFAAMHAKGIVTDSLLSTVKTQLAQLEALTVSKFCKEQESLLSKENEVLRQEIVDLKKKLVQIETINGKKQVNLPKCNAKEIKTPSATPAVQVKQETNSTEQVKTDSKPIKSKDSKKGASSKKSGNNVIVPETPCFSMLKMVVGEIVDVRRHEDADSLYVETVQVGEPQPRVVISGLVKHIPIDQMKRRCIFLLNLKPSKMRGTMSHAMVMCASSSDGLVEFISPPAGSNIGDEIYVEGLQGTPVAQLNPKKKIFETLKPDLRINEDGIATYKGKPWLVRGSSDSNDRCMAKTVRQGQIS